MLVSSIESSQILPLFRIIPETLSILIQSDVWWDFTGGVFALLFTLPAEQGLLFIKECIFRKHIKFTLILQTCSLSKIKIKLNINKHCMVTIGILTFKASTEKLLLSCIHLVLQNLEIVFCKYMAGIFPSGREQPRWKSREGEEGNNQYSL